MLCGRIMLSTLTALPAGVAATVGPAALQPESSPHGVETSPADLLSALPWLHCRVDTFGMSNCSSSELWDVPVPAARVSGHWLPPMRVLSISFPPFSIPKPLFAQTSDLHDFMEGEQEKIIASTSDSCGGNATSDSFFLCNEMFTTGAALQLGPSEVNPKLWETSALEMQVFGEFHGDPARAGVGLDHATMASTLASDRLLARLLTGKYARPLKTGRLLAPAAAVMAQAKEGGPAFQHVLQDHLGRLLQLEAVGWRRGAAAAGAEAKALVFQTSASRPPRKLGDELVNSVKNSVQNASSDVPREHPTSTAAFAPLRVTNLVTMGGIEQSWLPFSTAFVTNVPPRFHPMLISKYKTAAARTNQRPLRRVLLWSRGEAEGAAEGESDSKPVRRMANFASIVNALNRTVSQRGYVFEVVTKHSEPASTVGAGEAFFADVRALIGVHGGALYNAAPFLTPHRTDVIEMMARGKWKPDVNSSRWGPYFLSALSGARYSRVYGAKVSDTPSLSPWSSDVLMDVSTLAAHVGRLLEQPPDH